MMEKSSITLLFAVTNAMFVVGQLIGSSIGGQIAERLGRLRGILLRQVTLDLFCAKHASCIGDTINSFPVNLPVPSNFQSDKALSKYMAPGVYSMEKPLVFDARLYQIFTVKILPCVNSILSASPVHRLCHRRVDQIMAWPSVSHHRHR